MSAISVGIVNSGIGNISSLFSTLSTVGFKVKVSDKPEILNKVDILLLPGVGAFAAVMDVYNSLGLTDYIKEASIKNRPIIGICLGMQLLTNSSEESLNCKGLGLIPGKIISIKDSNWHIGWNVLKSNGISKFLKDDMGMPVYFNHGYKFSGEKKFILSVAEHFEDIPAIIKHNKIVGFQFHPEKSQDVGRYILQHAIEEIIDA